MRELQRDTGSTTRIESWGVALAAVLLAASTVLAASPLVNVDDANVILEGHDVVALHTEGTLLVGAAETRSSYAGATYFFASESHQRLFDASPERYAPQFGAHCAMAMAMGRLEPAVVDTWSIVDGRLVVQRNEQAKAMWAKSPRSYLEKADAHWPQVVAREGKGG